VYRPSPSRQKLPKQLEGPVTLCGVMFYARPLRRIILLHRRHKTIDHWQDRFFQSTRSLKDGFFIQIDARGYRIPECNHLQLDLLLLLDSEYQ
jgi:hypothetical protein